MRFWILGPLLLAGFLCLVGKTEAALSDYYHANERVRLWEIYDFICDVEGPDKQGMILPHRTDYKKSQSKVNNIGSGPGKRLTYSEFQHRLAGKGLEPLPHPEMTNPADDLENAIKDLNSARYNNALKLDDVYPPMKSIKESDFHQGGRLYDPKDPHQTRYTYMMELIDQQFNTYRTTEAVKKLSPGRLERIRTTTDRVEAGRRIGAFDSVEGKMRRDKDKTGDGFGLPAEKVKYDTVKSGIPGFPDYKKVNVYETFRLNMDDDGNITSQDMRDKGINTREDLIKWIDGLIDFDNEPDPKRYDPGDIDHWRAYKAWAHAAANAQTHESQLEGCGRT
ncbi:hypothetical protein FSARC_14572 [Fusarium sarcochroum]|uniref:Uncharacterized protein n=1 Tax=Fusarium sarcochroum TaxID=1208366 RepID=A0A8H4WP88_9HYPO|nr:hypothetical protein FSARC_14572 [Fusarium sarcochroum]